MVFIKVLALRKRFKWRAIIAIVLLQSLNVGAHSGQTVNRQNYQRSSLNREKQNNGKRNVLYNYVTDRPRVPFGRFYQTSRASPRSTLASIETRKQHLAQLLKYRQYLTKLYSKRRSDIDSPVLQGDISDYKDKGEYQESPEAGNQIKSYESVEDINKKYGPRMVGLNYFTKDVIPTDHVILPQQDYHTPIERSLGQAASYSQYSQTSNEDESEVERLIELEKLRELEELRGRCMILIAT